MRPVKLTPPWSKKPASSLAMNACTIFFGMRS
jgi:hypothetical protein